MVPIHKNICYQTRPKAELLTKEVGPRRRMHRSAER